MDNNLDNFILDRHGSKESYNSFEFNIILTLIILICSVMLAEGFREMGIMPTSLVMVIFLSVIIVSSITPGYGYGIFSAFIATLACDYFITSPRLAFSFTNGSPITLVTMLLASLLTSTITYNMNNQARLAKERELRANMMYEINQELLIARNLDSIIEIGCRYLMEHLKRPVIYYFGDPLLQVGKYYINEDSAIKKDVFLQDFDMVHEIFVSIDSIETKRQNANDGIFYIPIRTESVVKGIFGIELDGRELTETELSYTNILTGQVTLALELLYLSESQKKYLLETEKEKMRSTLLRSISHDLRTPLTSIVGASTAIRDQEDMDDEMYNKLLNDVIENSEWLIRLVENILAITKISEDTMKVTKTPEAAEEAVFHAVSIVRKRYDKCRIEVSVPDNLLIVPMDITLISQVIINLLENAAKYTDDGTLISVILENDGVNALFRISDEGNGINKELLDNLFNTHEKAGHNANESLKGTGIGLSICKTILDAHGGEIKGYNKPDGGAEFVFLLPLEEVTQNE